MHSEGKVIALWNSFVRTQWICYRFQQEGCHSLAIAEMQRFCERHPQHQSAKRELERMKANFDTVAEELKVPEVPSHIEGAVRHLRMRAEALGLPQPPHVPLGC